MPSKPDIKTHALCVSIHDVAPRTLPSCKKIADALQEIHPGLPLTLLVVPCYHGESELPREYVEWIEQRLARGDELALHGYTHSDEGPAPRTLGERLRRGVYTAREGEFAALARDEAIARIARGREWFGERGWPLRGFVAPAWLVSSGTWEALQRFDFLYTTTLTQFHLLDRGIALKAPTVVYSTRSAWRRTASRWWNSNLAHRMRSTPLVRVGFHPADAAYDDVMTHALALVRRLNDGRTALTKSAFASAVR